MGHEESVGAQPNPAEVDAYVQEHFEGYLSRFIAAFGEASQQGKDFVAIATPQRSLPLVSPERDGRNEIFEKLKAHYGHFIRSGCFQELT